ncbi:MAG TPA: hypothetical protein VNI20_07835, partial [Fimbriimonadaceae bacterium]|nr:hypothetical protein [Fimbriimonadaceae bacterium]
GHDESTSPANQPRRGPRLLGRRLQLDVGDMDHRSLEDRSSDQVIAAERSGEQALEFHESFRADVAMGGEMKDLAIELEGRAEQPIAQPHCIPDDRIEDRLYVGSRPTDDAQDLGGGSLLLSRLHQALVKVTDP